MARDNVSGRREGHYEINEFFLHGHLGNDFVDKHGEHVYGAHCCGRENIMNVPEFDGNDKN